MEKAFLKLLYIPIFIVIILLFRSCSFLSSLLASKWMTKNYDLEPLCHYQPAGTREKALEDLRSIETVLGDYIIKRAWYRSVILGGLIDGCLILLGIIVQIPMLWISIIPMILMMTFIIYMMYREGVQEADKFAEPFLLKYKSDEEVIQYAKAIQDTFPRIKQMSENPWKSFGADSIAIAIVVAIGIVLCIVVLML